MSIFTEDDVEIVSDLVEAGTADAARTRETKPPAEPGPPPRVDPAAPHGRTPEGKPLAPYGHTKDGRIRLRQGRQAKDTPPAAPRPPQAAPAGGDGKDRTEELKELAAGLWWPLALISPADAGALELHAPGMVKGWNQAAQQNERIGSAVDWLCASTWLVALAGATIPFAITVAANHGLPLFGLTREQALEAKEALAARTEAQKLRLGTEIAAEMTSDQTPQ